MLKSFKILFFIIPHHHIGGADRVHLNIIKSLKHKPFVFFNYSNTDQISEEFKDNAYCLLINSAKRRKIAILFFQIISSFLPIVIFGCNNIFFYKLVSKLKKKAKVIDLTHAFSFPDTGMEIWSLPYVDLLDTRVVINNRTFEDYKKLYKANDIKDSFLKRFRIISNGVKINDFGSSQIESRFSNFTIGFVGRNSPEKRPELFFDIVKNVDLKAKVIGDNFDNFKRDFPEVNYFENCNDPELIRKQFSEISLLVVTSSREGFPLVIMEAMELGVPVISTNVGSIAEHLINGENGFLISAIEENEFLTQAVEKIKHISENKDIYFNLSLNARQYACDYFDNQIFEQKYRKLFHE
jgi:glycosyltransferase involved in cell wall biosynthesis